jgi:DNA-binding transcriptional MocR family regulator
MYTFWEAVLDITSSTQKQVAEGMIDLGIGQPSLSLLPVALIEKASAHFMKRRDPTLLTYGFEQGDGRFREVLGAFLSGHYGTPVDPEHVLITNGASQALDLTCTLFTRAGDTILIEEPTYFLALKIFADHLLRVVSLPMDGKGLILEAVEEQIQRRKPAFLYTIPTHHNPTGLCLSASRRNRLVEMCSRHGVMVVADEVYHLLSYTAPVPPPLASLIETGTVLSLGSFSKILAPGLRLGWIQAGSKVIERFFTCGLLDSGGGLNPFTSGVVRSAIELGLLEQNVEQLKATYSRRIRAMIAALRAHLPGDVDFLESSGGFFLWLTLPEQMDALQIQRKALQRNVDFLPGVRFSSRGGLNNCLRLSFAFYDTPELEEGVKRLGRVLKN